jgi:hypothetical protein
MRRSWAAASILTLGSALAGCATSGSHASGYGPVEYRASCGGSAQTQIEWKLAVTIPINEQALRSLAAANPLVREGFSVESWFSGPAGQIMLCRTQGAPKESCVGEWWAFREEIGGWVVFGHDGWFCVT